MSVGVDVSANLQGGVSAVRAFTRTFEELRRAVREVNGELSKLDPGTRGEVESANKQLYTLLNSRSGRQLRQSLQDTGQYGVPFWNLDAGRLSSQGGAAGQRRLLNAAQMAGIPTGTVPPQQPGGGGGGQFGGGSGGQAFGGMLSAFGAAARFMLPLLGVGGVAGTLYKGISAAQDYDPGVDRLLRTLGNVENNFSNLNSEVKHFGAGLQLSAQESLRLLDSFARMSNIVDRQALTAEGRAAAGFARAYGLDPGGTAAQFGSMRFHGAGDVRDLALTVGQAVASSGMNARADEVLTAVSHFTQQAAIMLAQNPASATERYAGMYAGLVAGNPGMGGAGAANILGRADAAFQGGGGAGEASRVFLYRALGIKNPFAFRYALEGGLFGNDESGQSNYDKEMGYFNKVYPEKGMDPKARLDMLANLQGISMRQAEALQKMKEVGSGSGFKSFLQNSGVDPMQMAPDAIQNLAQIYNGQDLGGMRDKLYEGGTPDQRRMLRGASQSDLPQVLAQVAAQQGRERNLGTETLNTLTVMKDTLLKIGEPSLAALNQIVLNTRSLFKEASDAIDFGDDGNTPEIRRRNKIVSNRMRSGQEAYSDDYAGSPLRLHSADEIIEAILTGFSNVNGALRSSSGGAGTPLLPQFMPGGGWDGAGHPTGQPTKKLGGAVP